MKYCTPLIKFKMLMWPLSRVDTDQILLSTENAIMITLWYLIIIMLNVIAVKKRTNMNCYNI